MIFNYSSLLSEYMQKEIVIMKRKICHARRKGEKNDEPYYDGKRCSVIGDARDFVRRLDLVLENQENRDREKNISAGLLNLDLDNSSTF